MTQIEDVELPIPEMTGFYSKGIVGIFARWAVHQSPYACPAQLPEACEALWTKIKANTSLYEDVPMERIDQFLKDFISSDPVCLSWNEPKVHSAANAGGYVFVGRGFAEPHPDENFIDLDALHMNIMHTLRADSRADAERNALLTVSLGEPE